MRSILIILLILGVLLPKSGALLGQLAGFRTVVICTGLELQTITLDESGTPVDTEIEDHAPCLMAIPYAAPRLSPPTWIALIPTDPTPLRRLAILPRSGPWIGPPPDRGPPVRI
ncbi:hypothetical protein V8J82_11200 [Gymnodinialimonas sp. 2305UL16-5]|uniref:hypothetical protein n=1 Tax=Gymnodinialimonas mytili TaxID=3126503 RepID=UPI0030A1AC8C